LYVAMISGLVVLLAANIALLTLKRDVLRLGNPAVMMGLALVFAAADFFTNTSAHYQFGTLSAAGKPMESAVESSGFRKAALAGSGRNVLLIVVEALGEFADPWRQSVLLQPFREPDLAKRYDVTTSPASSSASAAARSAGPAMSTSCRSSASSCVRRRNRPSCTG